MKKPIGASAKRCRATRSSAPTSAWSVGSLRPGKGPSGAAGRDARERQQMAVTRRGGREAVTHSGCWKAGAGQGLRPGRHPCPPAKSAGGYSLLEVKLETGRTTRSACIWRPSATRSQTTAFTDAARMSWGRPPVPALVAAEVHAPETGETIDVSAPLPPDLESVLEQLHSR